jgi:NADH dehydrogenase FAD-containing subunit
MNYLINTLLGNSEYKQLHKQHKQQHKQHIVLLGDGFFARGFLHNIDNSKFNITQIYHYPFINPQDLMYKLQRNKKYYNSYHLRDMFNFNNVNRIREYIYTLSIDNNIAIINNQPIYYDHLVIGLGAAKALNMWKDQINNLVDKKDLAISIVGTGPTGIELATILSKYNKIHIFDMLCKDKAISYLGDRKKQVLLEALDEKGILQTFGEPYSGNNENVIFCVGTRNNSLTADYKVNDKLMVVDKANVYIGGDCTNTAFIKNGQVAYNQGTYVAKRLNGEISDDVAFNYNPNGISLNIGDKQVIIEGHNIIPDGIYPDIVIKLYSLFCI